MQALIVIAIIALLVVGPEKLPEVAKALGRAYGEFRKALDEATEDFKQTIQHEVKPEGKKPVYDELKDSLLSKQSDSEESKSDSVNKASDK